MDLHRDAADANEDPLRDDEVMIIQVCTAVCVCVGSLCVCAPGDGGASYNGVCGDGLPKKGSFFWLEVYKRIGISRVEV